MKSYEIFSNLKVVKDMPIIIRLDGRYFSRYTKALEFKKPFDTRLRDIFIEVSKDLIRQFNARYIYTFSDEINMLLEDIPFNGRIEKMDSVFASYATSSFNKQVYLNEELSEKSIKSDILASFDSRVIMTPQNIANYFKWRQDEAWRNCINSYAQAVLNKSHTPEQTAQILYKLNKKDLHDLLFENGINIAHVPQWQRRGIAVYKEKHEIKGVNPKDNTTTVSYRNKINVDMQLDLFSCSDNI
ncbi:MAG: tRNA(His) guanylyltransferase Thg1 family protein [Methanosphaera sp.]|nr:tRNA(His) guanylyltransferase Thg1 family protein [Methanosphaera sp.]